MTKEELFQAYPDIKALYDEAGAFRVVDVKTGAKVRTFSEARANDPALYRPDTEYCKLQLFEGLLQVRGEIPLSVLVEKNSPREHWEFAKQVVKGNLRPCQHEIVEVYYHLDDVTGNTSDVCTDENCERPPEEHFCEPVKDHTYDYPVPEPTTLPGFYSLDRNLNICETCGKEHPAGWGSVVERLKHAAGGPAPEILDADGWHTPDGAVINDLQEPLYIVRSTDKARELSKQLRIVDRWRERKLSRWYVHNCFYVVDAKTRERLMDMNLTKATVTGALSWKPVVLTFIDEELLRKLAQVCTQVVTVTQALGVDYLSEVQASVKVIEQPVSLMNDDMPLEVLDGWLGEVCRTRMLKDFPVAYAWPALLAAASALVGRQLLPEPAGGFQTRANMYVGIIGPVESGKTSVFNVAFWLLGLKAPELFQLKSGSPEGMASAISDIGGATRLVFVNELEHLMKKVNIEGSTFANFLNDVWYDDKQELVIARGKRISFNCRLSLAGGVPQQGFEEVFGVGSTTGLHSRFCLSVCPSDFEGYIAHPPDGAPALVRCEEASFNDDRPQAITVAPDVYEETKRWRKELKLSGRSVELAMRAAVICAAFDCRRTLSASQLGPALAFAKYQEDVHRRFEPNPGKNSEAIVGENVMRYLREKFSNGAWAERRTMLNSIHAWHHGASVVNRALNALKQSNEIELGNAGRKLLVRLVLEK